MRKPIFTLVIAGMTLLAGILPARAQTQITLGGSFQPYEVDFQGTGSAAINVNIRTCDLVSCTFAAGSASGSGAVASSDGSYRITTLATNRTIMTITQESAGSSSFVVTQNGPLNFSYSSPQGSLQGNITLSLVTQTNSNSAIAVGSMAVTGGSFASAFGSTGDVNLLLALGGDLRTLVNSNGTMTGEVEYPSTITPTQPSQEQCDFLTGGGWIPNNNASGPAAPPPGSGNGKATFAIEGGCKLCEPWGHLNYIDHGNGVHIQGDPGPTCPIAYSKTPGTTDGTTSNGQLTGCRRIRGSATANGISGYHFQVDACDKGEPGTTDTFSLTVTNDATGVVVYSNNGTLGGGVQGGGNIQLHKGNKSFCCAATQ